jgi:hypothetical protein
MKLCRQCGEEKPYSEFYPAKKTGEGYDRHCKACMKLRWNEMRAGKNARKKLATEQVANFPLATGAYVSPDTMSFRTVVETKARANWDKLADKLIDTALSSGRESGPALKMVMEYMLGKPDAAQDEAGPERFFRLVMAAVSARAPREQTDLDTTEGDPRSYRPRTDEEPGDSALWPEPSPAGSVPEARDGGNPEREE